MTGHEESHLDISRMHVQVLRSTFCLMILAVAILVIFSSVALLRNPKHAPMVNVMFDMAPGTDDQSARMRRGTLDKTSDAHAPVRRDILFKGGPLPAKRSQLGYERDNMLKKNKHIHNFYRNETKSWSLTKHKLQKSPGNHTKHRLEKSGNSPKHRLIDTTGNYTKHRFYMYGNRTKQRLDKPGNHTKHRLETFGNDTKHRTDKKKHYQLNSPEISSKMQKHHHDENITKTENIESGIKKRTERTRNDPYLKTLHEKGKNKNVSNSRHL